MGDVKREHGRTLARGIALYVCLVEGGCRPPMFVPRRLWRKAIYVAAGVTSPASVHQYTRVLEDMGMVERNPKGVVLMEVDLGQEYVPYLSPAMEADPERFEELSQSLGPSRA